MTSSAGGSIAFFVLALLTIIGLVLLLLRYYLPLRTTPAYVVVPVFLAIALPASIVVLLPVDLASSAGIATDGARGIWLPDTVVYKSWRIVYWLTFALTWAILPMLGEYCDSGYREPKARMLYALRSNGRYWLIMLGIGLVGSIYLIWWNGFERDTFKSLVMALAYTWGLILGIYLMGHGLVAFPRSLFRYASVSARLKRIQSSAPKIHEKLHDALEMLEQYEYQVVQLKQRKNAIPRDFQEWIDELAEKSNLPESRVGAFARTNATTIPPVVTERYLADLTRKLKRARHAKARFENEWDHVVRRALRTQAILDSKASKRLEFIASQAGLFDRLKLHTPYTRYHLHVHIIPALTYLTWIIAVLASISIVWSECVREAQDFGGQKLSIIGWTVVHRVESGRSSIGFNSQIIAAAWLCYMCICAFYSLTEIKIWGNRALVRRNTYQESATWYGLQVAKLTVPLSYNFLTMTDKTIWKGTMFYKFLGRLIVLTPLGEGFSAFFPIFILVPVFATAFGLYGKVKSICGFGDLLEDEEEDARGGYAGTGSWREGRALIERELQAANGNALGLSARSPTSPPNEEYADSSTPALLSNGTTTGIGAEPGTSRQQPRLHTRPERRRLLDDTATDDDDDSANFLETFASRVKNTFESADFSVPRPRWLGGDEQADLVGRSRRSRTGERAADRGNSFLGLFGGRGDEGRLRL
ncbi:similar to LMBR1 domain-containing protein [Plenodomus lingam JN3]|uniref:Similar to LMBR1 domain-containing protein n=1 Tax=Leptosphaeria maculans (strain JN3 / isolate v23.1.3 / race Av1-4-5-6-7-8) TaxID=985895 RepID=E5AAE6_LEPMJ|nr:similar to LMBR1 domain-containing protein [Plenodomus lingam JN3]CBY00637.1 similar to LMBR1 domain-containing protein [Plenodomus lingam JN3]